MINSKIIQALKSLEIPIYWMSYDGDDKEYIIFQTINQSDINFSDDLASKENIDIGLIYWFKDSLGAENIDKIRFLMKNNGFIKLNEKDLKDDEYYGRSFRFRYIEDLEI